MEQIYEHHLGVRYGETDQMGVVHHANYLLYMEEARTAHMASVGCSYAGLEREGVGLPVRRTEVRYRAPARYEDELCVQTRVGRVGAASITFHYEIVRPADGTHIASGSTELACISLASEDRSARPLPAGLRERMEALSS